MSKLVKNSWSYGKNEVCDIKINSERNIIKPKVHYVGWNNSQVPGIDFDKNWMIVACMESV